MINIRKDFYLDYPSLTFLCHLESKVKEKFLIATFSLESFLHLYRDTQT